MREQLQALKLSSLRKRAVAAGVSASELEAADDAPDVRARLVSLVLSIDAPDSGAAEALRAELKGSKLSALKRQASAAGASAEALDDADDADDIKAAVIELIVQARLRR